MKDFSFPASRPHICLPQINIWYCWNSVEFRIGVNGDVGTRRVEEDDGELFGFYISKQAISNYVEGSKVDGSRLTYKWGRIQF